MFRFHWTQHEALLQKYINPLHTHNAFYQFYVKDLYIFIEGPGDDSNGIETCRPSPINNILMIVVFDWTILHILYTELTMLRFECNKSNFEVNFCLMGKTNCKEAGFAIPTNRKEENCSADIFVWYQKRDIVCCSWRLVWTWIINVHAVGCKPVAVQS